MGCTTTKDSPSDCANEDLVHTYEATLGFSSVLATRLVAKVHDFCCSGRLNRQQFLSMMRAAGLYLEVLEDDAAPASRFYTLLGDGKRLEGKKASVLAVLLGKGTQDTKTELLFDLYQSERAIELPAVARMVQDVCSIALKFLPVYARWEVEDLGDEASLQKLSSYQTKLEVAYRFVVAKMRDNLEFGRRRVTLDDLKRSKMLKFILSPPAARQFATEVFEKIPTEKRYRSAKITFLTQFASESDETWYESERLEGGSHTF